MANYLSLRSNTIPANVVNMAYSTLTGSSIVGSTISISTIRGNTMTLNNSTISLGLSTNQTYVGQSNGSYAATSWVTAQSGLNANKKIQMSATGVYQLDLTSPTVYLSSDSGVTWSALGAAQGLPTTGTWLNGSISATGQYILLADSPGGSLYASSDYGASFNNTTPAASVASLYSWLKFNGNTTDTQGVATITAVGAPSYVTGITPGSQAISLANTAGSTATQYVRGTWTGSSNFTVSFWMNPQTLNGTSQVVFSSYTTYFAVLINANNQLTALCPSGGGGNYVNMGTSGTLSTNTWYFVTIIFQTNGLCSFYLNNSLVSSVVNTQGVGTTTATVYELGAYDSNSAFAFNGYIDDFKLTNAAISYQPVPIIPPAVWLKFEGNTTDSGSLAITPTVTGSVSYVTGAVGNYAVRLANTANGTATNYIRGTWNVPSNFTITFWFNVQSLVSNYQVIFDTFNGGLDIYINPSNNLAIAIPSGGGSTKIELITSFPLIINTWYHLTLIYQSGGLCTAYINNILVGNATNTGGLGTYVGTKFGLGTYDTLTSNAFNGYIDDLRIYNTAVPFNPMIPANYIATALSGSGQYALATTQLGTTIQSADYGVTWSNAAAAAGPQQVQADLALSHSGQYAVIARRKVVTPNLIDLGVTSWYQNGITWNVSVSSTLSATASYNLFNDRPISGWASNNAAGNLYDTTTGAYTGGANTTTVLTLSPSTTVAGEWIQLQSSTPLTLSGFNFATGNAGQTMKTYLICGSVNGSTWYPLQQGTMTTNPITTTYGRVQTVISVNYTGVQSLKGDQVGSVTTTAYSYATGSYTYFRWIATSIWATGSQNNVAFDELYPQFQANTISPQLTGLSTATWAQAGVVYTASASSTNGTWYTYKAFNNTTGDGWLSALTYSSGVTTGSSPTTTVQGNIGSVAGEYLQIQTSVPMVMISFGLGIGPNANLTTLTPRIYYIVGSNDGSTWYPIQNGTFSISAFTGSTNSILINYTGTQSLTGMTGSVSTTNYSYSTNAFRYFRMIGTTIMTYDVPANSQYMEIGEWLINFATPTLTSNNTLSTWSANLPQITTSTNVPDSTALSASGQYLLQTTKVQPYAWLPFDNAATDLMGNTGLTVTGSPAYVTDRLGAANAAVNLANTAGGTATKYVRGTWSGAPSFTVSFWVNPQTLGAGMIFCGGNASYGGEMAIVINPSNQLYGNFPSGGGFNFSTITTSYALTINTWYHVIYLFQSGGICSLYVNGTIIGSITNSSGLGSVPNSLFSLGTYPNQTIGAFNGYIDDFRLFNTALNATQVAALYNNQTALQCPSLSSSYLPSTSYVMPATLTPTTVITSTATSFNGQTQVITTNAADTPLARLTLDNTAADSQGSLTPATGAGTVTYSTAIKQIGTHSAYFNQTAGSTTPSVYLMYTLPSVLNNPSQITFACWFYATSAGDTCPIGFNNGSTVYGMNFNVTSTTGRIAFNTWNTSSTQQTVSSPLGTIGLNTWYHAVATYSSGIMALYVNGSLIGTASQTGLLALSTGAAMTNFMVGGVVTSGVASAFAGYVDDVRLYSKALTAAEVQSLYTYTNAANNVYYSLNAGSTWTPATVPSTESLQGCAVSADGSYLTAISNTATYTLNTNSTGFAIAVGAQAGQTNQGQNAIAIGNKAGQTNQTANSIVLNASGAAVNAASQGFYVAPIAQATASATGTLQLLGYGEDKQVVQSGITTSRIGSLSILTPGTSLGIQTYNWSNDWFTIGPGVSSSNGAGVGISYNSDSNMGYIVSLSPTIAWRGLTVQGYPLLLNPTVGNVGIGTTNPYTKLHIRGSGPVGAPLRMVSDTAGNEVGVGYYRNPDLGTTTAGDLWVHGVGSWNVGDRNFSFGCYPGAGNVLSLLASGKVGIGITNPAETVYVNTTAAPSYIKINSDLNQQCGIQFAKDGASRFYNYMEGNETAVLKWYTASPGNIMTLTSAGNLSIVGTLSKGGGSFDIVHPDPAKASEGYRLRHCFVEGPTRGDNIYRFTVTTIDLHAVISLPDYYIHLNENTQVWVSPASLDTLGYGAGGYDETTNSVNVRVNVEGTYHVLVIGTRKDKLMRDFWDATGGAEYKSA